MNARKKITFLALMMLISLALVAVPTILSHAVDWAHLCRDLGYAIFILAGIQIFETLIGHFFESDHLSLHKRVGLTQIHVARNDIEPQVAIKIRTARQIKIMATCLAGFHTSYAESIQVNMKKRDDWRDSPPIRMILMDPDSDGLFHGAVVSRNATFDRATDPAFQLWKATIKTIIELSRQSSGTLDVALNPYYPLDSIFIIDDDLYLTPYIYGVRGTMAPCYHFTRGGELAMFNHYEESFDRFWHRLYKAPATAGAPTKPGHP